MMRQEIDPRRQILFDPLQVALLLDGHVEKGPGVADRGGLGWSWLMAVRALSVQLLNVPIRETASDRRR